MKPSMSCRAIITIVLLVAAPFAAWATADGPDCWSVSGVARNDVLNIRARPDARSPIVGTIPPTAGILENRNDSSDSDVEPRAHPNWCKIRYKKITGWVACRFLEIPDSCEKRDNPDH